MALPLVLCVALLPTAACALRPPAALTRRQCTASAVIAAAGAALPRRANAQDASPSDTAARLVVDAQAAEPGGAYGTISAALSAAPKGATVLVRPGLYAERLFLKSEVNILADKGAVLTWTLTLTLPLTLPLTRTRTLPLPLTLTLTLTRCSPGSRIGLTRRRSPST